MKMLVIADIHGYYEKAFENFKSINTSKFDLMVCPGDFTDMFNQPPGFSQIDVADLLIQKLMAFHLPVFCVPGNHDPYEITDVFNEYDVNLHDRVRVFKGMKFLGFGGAETPFDTIFEPSEEDIRNSLDRLGREVKNRNFILVVHNPPKNTKLDMVANGDHVGSGAIRKFIEEKQPLVSISAHIHESPGTDKIGESVLFYPGPFYEGKYGIVDVRGDGVRCEIKTV